jgi:hypothetical protein
MITPDCYIAEFGYRLLPGLVADGPGHCAPARDAGYLRRDDWLRVRVAQARSLERVFESRKANLVTGSRSRPAPATALASMPL